MGSAYRVEIARSAMKEVGTDDRYRLRIGEYRVIYRVVDSERFVDVIHVRHRREAYQ